MTAGLFVALVGSDGSGKSSLCRDLPSRLAGHGEVLPVYFGSGDGPSSFLRRPLVAGRRVVDGRKPTTAGGTSSRSSSVRVLARPVWALVLAAEKRSTLRRARSARDGGFLVIADRFPQAQFAGINDGPLLHAWAGSGPLRRRLSAWESAPYVDAQRSGPDLVLRLVVTQACACSRRPDHDPEDLARRRAIVAGLRFDDPATTVVDLDADRPYEQVIDAAVAAIEARLLACDGARTAP